MVLELFITFGSFVFNQSSTAIKFQHTEKPSSPQLEHPTSFLSWRRSSILLSFRATETIVTGT
jgi:hypothetical protein